MPLPPSEPPRRTRPLLLGVEASLPPLLRWALLALAAAGGRRAAARHVQRHAPYAAVGSASAAPPVRACGALYGMLYMSACYLFIERYDSGRCWPADP